ncbi:hypothetical protein NMG60_11029995 [Bertholletia excelsa]
MAVAISTLFLGLNPKIITFKQNNDAFVPSNYRRRASFPLQMRYKAKEFHERVVPKKLFAVYALSSGVEDIPTSSSQLEDFSATASVISETDKLKITVEVGGAKTEAIFEDVFSKMVADAQPIPGFRRVKGGKTPDIPRDILLEVLGPTKVYKQVIKKVINSTISEYAEKAGLRVSKDLRIEQSFEDLEAVFEPGQEFSFDAVVQLLE